MSVGTDPRALSHVLFGNPLTITATEVAAHVVLAAMVIAAIVLCLPVLMATTFDAGHARTIGVRTGLVDTGVIVGLGLIVVVGLTTVGVLMALALCIAPATAARLLSARIGRVLALAGLLGAAAGLAGLLASYPRGADRRRPGGHGGRGRRGDPSRRHRPRPAVCHRRHPVTTALARYGYVAPPIGRGDETNTVIECSAYLYNGLATSRFLAGVF